MRHRYQWIVLAPDDHRRHVCGQVETVAGARTLPPDVDDRPDRVEERLAGVGVGQRHKAAPNLVQVGTRAQPGAPEEACHPVHRVAQSAAAEQRAAPIRRPVTPPPAGGGGVHVRGHHWRRAPCARSAPGTDRRTASPPRRRANARGSSRARSRARRAGRELRWRRRRASNRPSASPTSHAPRDLGQQPCSLRLSRGNTSSQVAELPAMPWMSTNRGPLPAVR